MIRYILVVCLCCTGTTILFAQQRKDMAISLSGGILNSPYYENAAAKKFVGIDFDYYLGKRHILSVSYFSGKHDYLDNQLSGIPYGSHYVEGTNGTVAYKTISILYKYKLINNKLLSIVPGVGAGQLTQTKRYPFRESYGVVQEESSWTDLVIPVSLDISFKLSSHWQAGVTGGLLIEPDFPVLALHAGPRISYVIK